MQTKAIVEQSKPVVSSIALLHESDISLVLSIYTFDKDPNFGVQSC